MDKFTEATKHHIDNIDGHYERFPFWWLMTLAGLVVIGIGICVWLKLPYPILQGKTFLDYYIYAASAIILWILRISAPLGGLCIIIISIVGEYKKGSIDR